MKVMRAVLVLMLLLPAAVWGAGERRVLVVHSYHEGYAWVADYMSGLRQSLGPRVVLDTFEMDTKRLPPSAFEERAEKAWQRYAQTQPDLVILADDNALKFLGPRLAAATTPVVYLGINNNPRKYVDLSAPNITGVLERPLMKRSVVSIGKIMQKPLKKVLVLFDSGETSRVVIDEVFQGESSQDVLGVQVDIRAVGSIEAWEKEVLESRQKGYDALVVGLYQTLLDAQGKNVPDAKVLEWTSKNIPVPPFAFWSFAVGRDKAIGGMVLNGRFQGEDAAAMVQAIFSGTPPSSLRPRTAEKGTFLFSSSQLEKWGLTLPAEIKGQAEMVD